MKQPLPPTLKILLGFAIFSLPIVFSWVTLKKGFSTKYRVISFLWLLLYIIAMILAPNKTTVPQPNAVTNIESKTESQPKLEQQKRIITEPAFNDCKNATDIVNASIPLTLKAISMYRTKSKYQQIALWRVNTFNSNQDELRDKYYMSPKDMMDLNKTNSKIAYNDILFRRTILVQSIFSAARQDYSELNGIQQQVTIINNAIKKLELNCPSFSDNIDSALDTLK